jgi:hypothetical protein
MANQQPSVADIFRRAQAIRAEKPQTSLKEIKELLVREYSGSPFPDPNLLTIPEQDDRAPEEDWTAGLPLVLRGIQQKDWKDIANGIVLSLEQTDGYWKQRGGPQDASWHDRTVGIKESTNKGVSKWMPEELMALAERNVKK